MKHINVDLGERSYPIFIGPGLLRDEQVLQPYLGKGRAVIVTNDVVAPLYLESAKQLLGKHYAGEIILSDGELHMGGHSQQYHNTSAPLPNVKGQWTQPWPGWMI